METWGFLDIWCAQFPGTFGSKFSQLLGFAMLTVSMVFVAMKMLRRPQ